MKRRGFFAAPWPQNIAQLPVKTTHVSRSVGKHILENVRFFLQVLQHAPCPVDSLASSNVLPSHAKLPTLMDAPLQPQLLGVMLVGLGCRGEQNALRYEFCCLNVKYEM